VKTLLEDAAFTIETVAHLKRLEASLLPLAEYLREIDKAVKKVTSQESQLIDTLHLLELLRKGRLK
jgi:hypothetical protein